LRIVKKLGQASSVVAAAVSAPAAAPKEASTAINRKKRAGKIMTENEVRNARVWSRSVHAAPHTCMCCHAVQRLQQRLRSIKPTLPRSAFAKHEKEQRAYGALRTTLPRLPSGSSRSGMTDV
jgi:hypothetical protein